MFKSSLSLYRRPCYKVNPESRAGVQTLTAQRLGPWVPFSTAQANMEAQILEPLQPTSSILLMFSVMCWSYTPIQYHGFLVMGRDDYLG